MVRRQVKEWDYLFLSHLVVVLGQPSFQSTIERNDLLSATKMERFTRFLDAISLCEDPIRSSYSSADVLGASAGNW